jgi:phosphoglycerate dehydrogenase-like enzyme
VRVLIACPLEADLAERVAACDVVDELMYDPELLPVARYPNDHAGTPRTLDDQQTARWHAMVANADVLFSYPGESTAGLIDMLARGTDIRFVQGTSAGMGAHIRRAAFAPDVLERVAFASAAGVHAGMLAEFAFYGLLAIRKDAHRLARARAERAWDHFVMGELDGSTIAVVGMGQIGRAIATRARAFGMHVIGVTRTGAPDPLADETIATHELATIAPRCNAVAVTLPITELTSDLVSAAVIAALPRDAVVINVGRGAVVDQPALIDALQRDAIAGAVLDVFTEEPLPADNPLWTAPNVVMATHTAAISIHENARIIDLFCDNLRRFARGDELRNRVNLREFY